MLKTMVVINFYSLYIVFSLAIEKIYVIFTTKTSAFLYIIRSCIIKHSSLLYAPIVNPFIIISKLYNEGCINEANTLLYNFVSVPTSYSGNLCVQRIS
jgi:hypothetical protein